MIRSVVSLVILAALVWAAVWVADQPGGVALNWLGYRIQTDNVGVLIVLALGIAILAAVVYRFWLGVRAVPGRFVLSRKATRQQKGYKALTQGMVAVAAGDAGEAQRQAKRADQLLADPPLTMLLSAQAAQLSGDDNAARNYFTAMLDNPDTAFLGLRGLLMQAQREGDRPAALSYAQRARELRPKTPWVLTTLFDLQAGEKRWAPALTTLDDAIRQKALSGEDGIRLKRAVLLGCSTEAAAGGSPREALTFAKKAYRLSPDFIPAVLAIARLTIEAGKGGAAGRVIQEAWARAPHPELARLFAETGGDESALKKVRRMERLLAQNPDHVESQIAVAEAALAAELWGVARGHLEKAAKAAANVAEGKPSSRVCRLMAQLEESERGDVAAARSWLLRAAEADPDPAWLCAECGSAWPVWSPACEKCDSIGSIGWAVPQRVPNLLPSRAPDTAPSAAAPVKPAEAETEKDATPAALPPPSEEAEPPRALAPPASRH